MIDVPEVVTHFGSATNQFVAVPMARVMQINDVLNNLIVWGGIFPIEKSENAIIATQVDRLAADSITLFDRGYPSFSLIYLMANQESPRHNKELNSLPLVRKKA